MTVAALWYVGDEASAAGFRLAGARIAVPAAGEERAVLATARAEASLVLISARVATRLSTEDVVQAELSTSPLVLVVPDLQDAGFADRAARLGRELGIEDGQ